MFLWQCSLLGVVDDYKLRFIEVLFLFYFILYIFFQQRLYGKKGYNLISVEHIRMS